MRESKLIRKRRAKAALYISVMLVAMSLLCSACGRGQGGVEQTPSQGQARDIRGTLEHDGLERTYLLHLPPAYDGEKSLPVLLAFHGSGGDGEGMARLTHLSDIADAKGFIVAYPDGIDENWNDGRPEINPGIDDLGFISALIDKLQQEYGIDTARVYSAGISNGGMFSLRLACELSDKIAAVAPVAALMGEVLSQSCSPPRPVAVMFVMGTADPLVPWEGGDIGTDRVYRGRALSADASVAFWVTTNGCSPDPAVRYLPDEDPYDGTRVRSETYTGGRDGSEVVMLAVEGGGHTWPGGRQYMREAVIGKTSRDLDAGEAIWQFCSRFQLR